MRAAALAAAVLLSACSLGVFDDIENRADSDSNGAPPEISSARFGVAIADVPRQPAGLRFVVAGDQPPSLSTFEYDEDFAASSAGTDLLPGPPPPPGGLVIAGAGGNAGQTDGLVAVGGLGNRIELYSAGSSTAGPDFLFEITSEDCGGLEDLGKDVVLARTDAGNMQDIDLVALSADRLVLLRDIDVNQGPPQCFSCTLQNDFRGTQIEPMELDPAIDGIEILLTSSTGNGSRMEVFFGNQIVDDDGSDCFSATAQIGLGGLAPDFGARVAVGDKDGDRIADLAFMVPSAQQIVVFPNLDSSGPGGPSFPIPNPTQSPSFGASMTWADVTDDGHDELIVGDPLLEGSGQAHIFRVLPDRAELLGEIFDSQPEDGQEFGRALATGSFAGGPGPAGPGPHVVLVGAAGEVFTYFQSHPDGDDPREN